MKLVWVLHADRDRDKEESEEEDDEEVCVCSTQAPKHSASKPTSKQAQPAAPLTHPFPLPLRSPASQEGGKKKLSKAAKAKARELAGQPKRPPNSYMSFVNEKRAEVKEAHPDASITEQSKLLGNMWKKMSEEER